LKFKVILISKRTKKKRKLRKKKVIKEINLPRKRKRRKTKIKGKVENLILGKVIQVQVNRNLQIVNLEGRDKEAQRK
tara:strand:+ start:490 stop:720 length:231 start_codon:yes stop_codon:yes gene_type:complete